ncbi:MAG: hypothetical protein EB051_03115 [Chlamydiia bacterium]|nr:hypothetical protein [Chlamydiia bacterium]
MGISSVSNTMDQYRTEWIQQASPTEQEEMSKEIQDTDIGTDKTPMDSFAEQAPCSDADAPPQF